MAGFSRSYLLRLFLGLFPQAADISLQLGSGSLQVLTKRVSLLHQSPDLAL